MAKTIFLTSASSVESNKVILEECIAKQCIPDIIVKQLGRPTIAIPTQNLGLTCWNKRIEETGAISVKVSVSGVVSEGLVVPAVKGATYNFKLDGWVKIYHEGIEVPEGTMTCSESEYKGLLILGDTILNEKGEPVLTPQGKPKKNRMWFDVSSSPRFYVVPTLVEENHYVLDQNGQKILTGTDSEGKPVYALAPHMVLSFAIGYIDAPLAGNGTSGGGAITKESRDSADAFLNQLLGTAPAEALVTARSI